MLNARLPQFIRDHYECYEWKHASAILTQDFPSEWADLLDVLSVFRLRKSWITKGGGNKSQLSTFIDGFLSQRGCFGNRMEQQGSVLRPRPEQLSPAVRSSCS
jgi:hypothetical protein